ncbi:MAG: NFACT family protein [Oscillospiraceae bacterium]|nr:NFACT family protein [Oscillospiraceae bacterium]
MPFDAVFLRAVTQELAPILTGARLDKIQMPARDLVLLQFHGQGGSGKLLLSSSSASPRLHLTKESFENPAQPPMFCMLLRKHLSGARIVSLTQPPMERLVDITLEHIDELGELSQKHLILELMGRNSNLILTAADGHIIDCQRRVDLEMSEKRQVLPGLFYRLPPATGKLDPTAVTPDRLQELLCAACGMFDKWLLDTFGGLSPLVCRELCLDIFGDTEVCLADLSLDTRQSAAEKLFAMFGALYRDLQPVMLLDDQRPADFSFRPIRQYGGTRESKSFESFSLLLDSFYAVRDHADRMRQKTQSLTKTISNLQSRTARKLENQRKELTATYDRERLRQLGDIVTANIHAIQRGQSRLTAVDFYDPDMNEIDIPLSVQLSPQQNAARFYKDYTKAKNAEKILTEQIAKGEIELDYLGSILDELKRAETEKDVAEIRLELVQGGYVRDTDRKKQMKVKPTGPMEFVSSEGFTILVGRNNRQNDELTLKQSAKSDLWFHVQKLHGSHVIVRCEGRTPGDDTITEAAQLAAWYSEARQSKNVPVDVAPVKQIKKPVGGKPGMVIYHEYRTVIVDPKGEI